jgi:hypothetical protein
MLKQNRKKYIAELEEAKRTAIDSLEIAGYSTASPEKVKNIRTQLNRLIPPDTWKRHFTPAAGKEVNRITSVLNMELSDILKEAGFKTLPPEKATKFARVNKDISQFMSIEDKLARQLAKEGGRSTREKLKGVVGSALLNPLTLAGLAGEVPVAVSGGGSASGYSAGIGLGGGLLSTLVGGNASSIGKYINRMARDPFIGTAINKQTRNQAEKIIDLQLKEEKK